jgi:Mn-dependent DtxR family transcriptional regulator
MYEHKLTEMEEKALKLLKEHYEKYGVPMKVKDLEKRMNIRGGTRQRLLERLVEIKLIKTVVLEGRGKPLGIIPL